MVLNPINKSYYQLTSPLDQFNPDTDDEIVLEFFFCSALEFLDFLGLVELIDSSSLEGLGSGLASNYAYSDEDSDESEWEDNEENVGNNQSSIFVSNLSGILPGGEVSSTDASATFFFSFSSLISTVIVPIVMHAPRVFSLLYPIGTPLYILAFIISIEFISYVARVISLGMRLFANLYLKLVC